MAELLTIQDMANGHLNANTLDEVVNGDENTVVTTRTGREYPSIEKTLRLMTEMGIGFTAFETKALMTASEKADGTYAVVTNDTAANNGVYLKKSDLWTLVPWNNFSNLDGLQINSGKVYPFRTLARNGQAKSTRQQWNNAILDVKVLDAKNDNYYRIAYFANGNTGYRPDGTGWTIYRYTKSEWSSGLDVTGTELVSARDAQQKLATSGVDTITIVSSSGESFVVTVDTAKLPTYGLQINSLTSASDGYTDIIDPSNYVYVSEASAALIDTKLDSALGGYDSVTINKNKTLPLKKATRNGVTSIENNYFKAALLDIKVINAVKGCYYGITYYTNGNTAITSSGEGWRIERYNASDFSTTDNKTTVVDYRTAQRPLKDGVDTITIESVDNEVFVITVDKDGFPAYGSFVNASLPASAGYSYIIDPSCYLLTSSSGGGQIAVGTMSAKLTSGVLSVVYPSGSGFYRLNFAPNGYNNLPNVVGFDYSVDGQSWAVINSATTDWLPPIAAVADSGDGGAFIYTGGNHGADGGSGGGQTARNIYYDIKFDGSSQPDFDAAVNKVEITIINEIMASNTISYPRYAVRQAFKIVIHEGSIDVSCQHTALEPLQFKTDNALQSVTTGMNDTYLILNGQYTTRRSWEAFDSGAKSDYPNAWAVITQSTQHQFASWMDRGYEAGDGRYVNDATGLVRRNTGAGSSKVYHAAVNNFSVVMAKGDSYRWRGGYHIKGRSEKPTGADSQFNASDKRVIVYSGSDYMTV